MVSWLEASILVHGDTYKMAACLDEQTVPLLLLMLKRTLSKFNEVLKLLFEFESLSSPSLQSYQTQSATNHGTPWRNCCTLVSSACLNCTKNPTDHSGM